MNITDQRAACARFMGWHKENLECVYDGPSGVYANWWCDDANKIVIRCRPYHPDLDTPESREQANELLHKVYEAVFQIEISFHGYPVSVQIYPDVGDTVFEGIGKWWNPAFVEAVAKLQIEREKK